MTLIIPAVACGDGAGAKKEYQVRIPFGSGLVRSGQVRTGRLLHCAGAEGARRLEIAVCEGDPDSYHPILSSNDCDLHGDCCSDAIAGLVEGELGQSVCGVIFSRRAEPENSTY